MGWVRTPIARIAGATDWTVSSHAPELEHLMANRADATAELEFEHMQDAEFQDVLKQIASTVEDIHAGRCDSRLTSLGVPSRTSRT